MLSLQLEQHLNEMQREMENLLCERNQLEGHLQTAITERRMTELMLEELEEEHDKAIVKIDMLESEVRILSSCRPFIIIKWLAIKMGPDDSPVCVCVSSGRMHSKRWVQEAGIGFTLKL